MNFENLVYEVSEILHDQITKTKDQLLSKQEFKNLTMSQWCYLEAIYYLKNPTYSQLAEKLNYAKASVSTSINNLIELGYVHKVQSIEDQRFYNIFLTEKGELAISQHIEAHLMFAKRLKSCLSEEQANNLIEICEILINNFQQK